MNSYRVELSPITRTSGPLNVELMLDGSTIMEARCNGSLFRGFERMMIGRKLEDAAYFSQRVCGICSLAHGLVASMAVEDALSWPVSQAASILREVMLGLELLQNHIRHFYLLCLPDYLQSSAFPVPSADEGDYRFNPDETNILVDHYFLALTASRLCHESIAVLAAKAPHAHGILPGGVSMPPAFPLILKVAGNLEKISEFVLEVYQKDIEHLQDRYGDYYQIGRGLGYFLSYGGFQFADPDLIPSGVWLDNQKSNFSLNKITVSTAHSWFDSRNQKLPEPDKSDGYTWIKAPRYDDAPMEVGPLARAVIAGRMPPQSSTMARIVARALEAAIIAPLLAVWLTRLDPTASYYNSGSKNSGQKPGIGLSEVHRGGLLHRMTGAQGQIS
ncbi:MAG: nickel-dependent hydrogenase large subunit, partial [Methylocystaceae bacterium]